MQPPAAQAQFRRGVALQDAGQLDCALGAYSAALAIAPGHAEALYGSGVLLAMKGQADAAAAAQKRALRLPLGQADDAAALGSTLLEAARAEEAAVLLAVACSQHPHDARIFSLMGRSLLALGRIQPAIGALLQAVALQPEDNATRTRLVSALFQVGDMHLALVHGQDAFRREPDHRHATTLSGVLNNLCRYDDALAFANHALSLAPRHPEALLNQALALEGVGRFEEAVAAGQEAIAAAPGNPLVLFEQGQRLLGLGRMTAEAWNLHERRLQVHGKVERHGVRVWAGENISGLTILLHAEQGLGDTLQFVRYAPLVAPRAGRVILAVQPPLLGLLRAVPGVDQVVAVGAVLPAFDVVCPLLSLPRIFGTTLESIPPALPYADAFAPWGDSRAGLRVGLVWAGNPGFGQDRHRSVPVGMLARLAGMPGVQFYSLQQHGPAPPELSATDLMSGVQDFADTAARVAGLDLVISVDTAVAHLAATMGKPVWLLSRFRGCWRWLHDRAESPWYPSLRILRQQRPGDWDGVIEQVRDGLSRLTAQPIERPPAMIARPMPAAPQPCKACRTPSPAIGAVDFNRSCEDWRRVALPLSGRRVTYHRCQECGLLFTGDFDAWTREDFLLRIYNDGYANVDPDYAGLRPAASAEMLGAMFGSALAGMDVLDYGGGNGALADLLTREHGARAETYDPFDPAYDIRPGRSYQLVTCFEVLEHTPDPQATIQEIASLVAADGLVVFSTLLQPPDFAQQGLNWWYVAPRNGHVTMYSATALAMLWREAGFEVTSTSAILHQARRVARNDAGLCCEPKAVPSGAAPLQAVLEDG